jgi:hypothetical protein
MRAIAYAAIASVALAAVYLALGGASYAPAKVADPCAPRERGKPHGFGEVAERIVLSALDDLACKLGVSREEIVLAFASGESLEHFAGEQGVSKERLEEQARSALVRGIDDAERTGALDPTLADILRAVARRIPVADLLDLLQELEGL